MAMQAQQIQDQDWVEVRTRFGTLPVNKANLLDFPKGLPGFEELHQFVLLHDEDNTSVFYLQSTEDPAIRLPLSSPHWFKVDYEIGLVNEAVTVTWKVIVIAVKSLAFGVGIICVSVTP